MRIDSFVPTEAVRVVMGVVPHHLLYATRFDLNVVSDP
jgi:hypothetical protein